MIRSMLVIALLVSAGAAHAQSNWSQSQVGGYRYYNGTVNGQPFNGTQSQIGNYSYGNYNLGGHTTNCTSSRVGSYVYTNCN